MFLISKHFFLLRQAKPQVPQSFLYLIIYLVKNTLFINHSTGLLNEKMLPLGKKYDPST